MRGLAGRLFSWLLRTICEPTFCLQEKMKGKERSIRSMPLCSILLFSCSPVTCLVRGGERGAVWHYNASYSK
ncbi:hypothetical protein P175DRAFT_0379455 [Aspergillus ochraceoroseus IBT 24754]|uniref:Secreted protein n=1 Tax=Aspergillus ochraceoroseus IBT 24754 TaxID=1392256 RepID=A0A2T5LNG4_9EURO|nr:uncharacterized protein P175DRAFT_0379455 [Aspergillus ochraceoroseus IBT 24754]PTU17817.1 hypothetical protein P175DRAFT_0379455 [Aspergillus ochraceoroseus IBT 24754]